MRIVYITDAFAIWGGIERVLAEKMNYLVSHYGSDVFLITINQGDHLIPFAMHPSVKHIDLDVRMHRLYAYKGLGRLIKRSQLNNLLVKRLKKVLREIEADVIVCVKLDFVSALNKVRDGVPLIVESHSLYKAEKMEGAGWLRRLHVWQFKQFTRRADAIIALTEGDANDWRRVNSRVYVIPNIVHLNNTGSYSDCTNRTVIFVGRFTKQKDIDSLLRIWEIVYSCHPDWTLEVYGDGHIDTPGVQVYKPVADIMDRYCNSSVLVLTSLFEPFGLVLPEAMSCGLPVVAFDCPYGPADIITDGVDGFLVKNRDVNEFADRVCQLIEDKNLRIRMGQVGIKSSQRYRADLIMPKWKELFEKLCQKE